MKNYEAMSDFEINELVLAIVSELDVTGGDPYYGDKNLSWNYCNNPSDAWPIIVENNISITKHINIDEWEVFGGGVCVDYDHCIISECGCFCSNKNPLRAAMIVFLMMQESKS